MAMRKTTNWYDDGRGVLVLKRGKREVKVTTGHGRSTSVSVFSDGTSGFAVLMEDGGFFGSNGASLVYVDLAHAARMGYPDPYDPGPSIHLSEYQLPNNWNKWSDSKKANYLMQWV